MPVDFEAGGDRGGSGWSAAGFDPDQPAVVASTGVSMYLTRDANAATLRQIAALAPGSTLAMTFLLPLELLDAEDRPGRQAAENGARAAGTPVPQLLHARRRCWRWPASPDSREARHVSADDLNERYFAGRADGLRMAREDFLVAGT